MSAAAPAATSDPAPDKGPVMLQVEDRVYRIGRTLGKGQYGKVKLGALVSSGQKFAIKFFSKTKLSAKEETMLARELSIVQVLDHPHIVHVFDVIKMENGRFAVVTEFCKQGEIFDFLLAHKRLREAEARRLFRQLLSAVDYIHSLGFVHRDIKLENVLLDSLFNVKLADFGFARAFAGSTSLRTSCGSPHYAAPEVLFGDEYRGPEVDIWSLGVLLYALLVGTMPYKQNTPSELRATMRAGAHYEPSPVLTSLASTLLDRMLCLDGKRRITMAELRSHPWVIADAEPLPVPFRFSTKDIVELTGSAELCDPDIIAAMTAMGVTFDTVEVTGASMGIDLPTVQCVVAPTPEITAVYSLIARRRYRRAIEAEKAAAALGGAPVALTPGAVQASSQLSTSRPSSRPSSRPLSRRDSNASDDGGAASAASAAAAAAHAASVAAALAAPPSSSGNGSHSARAAAPTVRPISVAGSPDAAAPISSLHGSHHHSSSKKRSRDSGTATPEAIAGASASNSREGTTTQPLARQPSSARDRQPQQGAVVSGSSGHHHHRPSSRHGDGTPAGTPAGSAGSSREASTASGIVVASGGSTRRQSFSSDRKDSLGPGGVLPAELSGGSSSRGNSPSSSRKRKSSTAERDGAPAAQPASLDPSSASKKRRVSLSVDVNNAARRASAAAASTKLNASGTARSPGGPSVDHASNLDSEDSDLDTNFGLSHDLDLNVTNSSALGNSGGGAGLLGASSSGGSKRSGTTEAARPRTDRTSVSASNTSARKADDLLAELLAVLFSRNIHFVQAEYVVRCTSGAVQFDIEVLHIPRLDLHSIRFSRLSGDLWEYKTLHNEVLSSLKL